MTLLTHSQLINSQRTEQKIETLMQTWEDPIKKKRQRYQQSLRRHKELLFKVSYRDLPDSQTRRYKYSSDTLMPFLFFYKLLARKPATDGEDANWHKLILNIPDTIVYGDGDLPVMWFYTDAQGCVNRVDGINGRQVCAKLVQRAVNEQLVAVLKKPSYDSEGMSGNDLKIISARELKELSLSLTGSRGEFMAIQRFVKCNSVKPFIVRTAWRRDSNPECWVITSNYEYDSKAEVPELSKVITNSRVRNACTFVKSSGGRFLKETLKYLDNIRKYLKREIHVQFQELVCDFIKDEGDNWWYINTKAFVLKQKAEQGSENAKINIKHITMYGELEDIMNRKTAEKKTVEHYQKCKPCKYCSKVFPEHLMTHKLTLIMLLQADKHLLARGKSFSWLQRCFSQHIGNVNLYIEHKVCDSCFRLYKQIEKLMRLEREYASMLGISIKEDSKSQVSITAIPAFKGQSPQFGSRLQKTSYEQKMPENWGFPSGSPMKIDASMPQNLVNKYRMMVLIHCIQDIPRSALEDNEASYCIQYEAFEQRIRYKLNFDDYELQANGMIKININKIRVFFFFAQSRKQLNNYLKTQECLRMYLLQNGKRIAELGLELAEFLSDRVLKRDFYKMFSGRDIFPILSWGMQVTLGFHEMGQLQQAHLKLHGYEGLYVHDNQDYYTCDPLPEEWVLVLQQKNAKGEQKTNKTETLFNLDLDSPLKQLGSREDKKRSLLSREVVSYSRRKIVSSKQMRKVYYL